MITRYARVSAFWPVTIHTARGGSAGIVENLSPSGAFIACDHQPHLLETVDLTVEVSEQALPLNLTATVVRRDVRGVGVTFEELPRKAQRVFNEAVTESLLSEFGDWFIKHRACSRLPDQLKEALKHHLPEYGGVGVTLAELPGKAQRVFKEAVTESLLSEFGDWFIKHRACSRLPDQLKEALEHHLPEYGMDWRSRSIRVLTLGKRCPKCKSHNRSRIRRRRWMRLLPGSRHYVCSTCGSRFLHVCRLFSFLLNAGSNRQ